MKPTSSKAGRNDPELGTTVTASIPKQRSPEVEALLLRPAEHDSDQIRRAINTEGVSILPDWLEPLAIVDDDSIACVVQVGHGSDHASDGAVVRWFLRDVEASAQASPLDVNADEYLKSLDEELAHRNTGLVRVLDEIGPAYERSHVGRGKRPRDFVVRPIRIACQNVIVGLAAIAQDSSFDGLSVVAWQTCEVPHLATHEANRALAALTLCDAFQNGGTMEIRFDQPSEIWWGEETLKYPGHPEGRVPASLRRFGRTLGVQLGAEDPAAIVPSEARQLFMAITPMPTELRNRVTHATTKLGLVPERICFTLLAGVWQKIALDFLLATTGRADSILQGGAQWEDRPSRKAESDVCRAAVMAGMLFDRLNSQDHAATPGDARVVEDRTRGVEWSIDADLGTIRYSRIVNEIPWTNGIDKSVSITVAPRVCIDDGELAVLAAEAEAPFFALVPRDAQVDRLPPGVGLMRCPDRLADLDKAIEDKLSILRTSR